MWLVLWNIGRLRLVGMRGHVLHARWRSGRGANIHLAGSFDVVRVTTMNKSIVFGSDGRSQVAIGYV